MSVAAIQYVKHLRQAPNGDALTPAEKSVLFQLADDHNEDKGCAWPAVGKLAHRAGMTERHCRRMLRKLEDKGVIELNPRLRENGGRSSSEFRFVAIDPPFDKHVVLTTAKRMQMQAAKRMARPVQAMLLPPDTDVRGVGTPMSGGPGHREPEGADTDVRGSRTPMSPQDLLLNPLPHPEGDLAPDPKEPTLPAQGRVSLPPVELERWDLLKRKLQEALISVPRNVAAAQGFTVIAPSPGHTPHSTTNDYDVCFRGWWLEDVKRLPNGLLLVTMAEDEDATEAGLKKYAKRLQQLAHQYFGNGLEKPVTFKLLRSTPAATPSPVPAGPLFGNPIAVAADLIDPWERVKRELSERLFRLRDRRASAEAMDNFRNAIERTQLVSVEMDGAAPVWKIAAPNVKKTRAVLSLLHKHVRPAIATIAGPDVQLIVFAGASGPPLFRGCPGVRTYGRTDSQTPTAVPTRRATPRVLGAKHDEDLD